MNKATKIIIALVIVAIVAGLSVLVLGTSRSSAPEQTSPQPNDQDVSLTINYTNSGFAPATVTVTAGNAVKVINQSNNLLSFASGDHPTHQINSELNIGDIKPGDSKTFTPTKKGTWSFHDHYKAANGGKLIVE